MKVKYILIFIFNIILIFLLFLAPYFIDLIKKEKCLNTPFSEMKEIDYCKEYWNNEK